MKGHTMKMTPDQWSSLRRRLRTYPSTWRSGAGFLYRITEEDHRPTYRTLPLIETDHLENVLKWLKANAHHVFPEYGFASAARQELRDTPAWKNMQAELSRRRAADRSRLTVTRVLHEDAPTPVREETSSRGTRRVQRLGREDTLETLILEDRALFGVFKMGDGWQVRYPTDGRDDVLMVEALNENGSLYATLPGRVVLLDKPGIQDALYRLGWRPVTREFAVIDGRTWVRGS